MICFKIQMLGHLLSLSMTHMTHHDDRYLNGQPLVLIFFVIIIYYLKYIMDDLISHNLKKILSQRNHQFSVKILLKIFCDIFFIFYSAYSRFSSAFIKFRD